MKTFKIILSLFTIALLFSGCSHSQHKEKKEGKNFNILLISIDTLRADHLHCYGYEYQTSPRIDELAEKSLCFEYTYCPIPKTSASFASMMTGLHPFIHKTKPNLGFLKEKYLTLAEILKAKGYATAAVVDNVNLSRKFSYNQGFQEYIETWNETEKKEESTSFITARVLSFLKKKREKPFFLWANYIETHSPYVPPAHFIKERPQGRDIRSMKKAVMPGHIKKQMAAGGNYNEGHYIALYDGAVQYIDAELGKIMELFYKSGLHKNTVLIFTADHGEDLGERNYFFDHGPLVFNAAARVPLLVYIPGEKARRIKTPVSIMDIYPTILELLKIDFPPYPLQGVDLLTPRQDRVFFLVGWVGTYGIVKNNLHYIDVNPKASKRFNLAPEHFYDIYDDPYEQKNRYNKYKIEARKMSAEYMAYYNKHGYFKRDQRNPKEKLLTKREVKRLRALGYL